MTLPRAPRLAGLIEAYRSRMPVADDWKVVTLLRAPLRCAGTAPCPSSPGARCTSRWRLNPTGSFTGPRNDDGCDHRSQQRQAGRSVRASTATHPRRRGTTRAGITCAVLIPEGKIAMGKLAQAVMHGAKIIQDRR